MQKMKILIKNGNYLSTHTNKLLFNTNIKIYAEKHSLTAR